MISAHSPRNERRYLIETRVTSRVSLRPHFNNTIMQGSVSYLTSTSLVQNRYLGVLDQIEPHRPCSGLPQRLEDYMFMRLVSS